MKASEVPPFVLCAAPAVEMLIRFSGNLYNIQAKKEDAVLRHELAGNFIGTVFLGVCAYDAFPGARLCGSICFIAYSYFKEDPNNRYWTSQQIYKIWDHKVKTMTILASGYFAYRYMPQETVSKMRDIFSRVFTNV